MVLFFIRGKISLLNHFYFLFAYNYMWYIIIILGENLFGNFYKCEFSLQVIEFSLYWVHLSIYWVIYTCHVCIDVFQKEGNENIETVNWIDDAWCFKIIGKQNRNVRDSKAKHMYVE